MHIYSYCCKIDYFVEIEVMSLDIVYLILDLSNVSVRIKWQVKIIKTKYEEFNTKIQDFTCSDYILDLWYLNVCILYISRKSLPPESNLSYSESLCYNQNNQYYDQ